MIGKPVRIAAFLVLFIALIIVALLSNLSALGAYAVKQITDGEVEASTVSYRFDRGRILLALRDLSIKGSISGTIRSIDISGSPTSRPFFKKASMSDFDLTIRDLKGKGHSIPLPAELLEIRTGVVNYNGQKLIVDEIRCENLGAAEPFRFSLAVRNNSFFRSLSAEGQGSYKGKGSDIQGSLRISGVDLNRLSKNMKGTAAVEGPFTYAGERFSLTGSLGIQGLEFEDRLLRKPLTIARQTAEVVLSHGDTVTDIKVNNLMVQDIPVSLKAQADRLDLRVFELTSGFLSIEDGRNYIALDTLAKGSFRLLNSIRQGRVKIAKLYYERTKPLHADLEFKDIGATYKNLDLTDIDGFLRWENDRLTISKLRGAFGSSRFTDAAGTVSLDGDRSVKVRADYLLALKDVPHIIDVGALKLKGGNARGVMEVEGNEKRGYKISGTGNLQDGHIGWQNIGASARGSYRFTNDGISFDPLVVARGGTDMVVRGGWDKKGIAVSIKGTADAKHLKQLTQIPLETEGTVGLDLVLKKDGTTWHVDGSAAMDNLVLAKPNYFRKEKGTKAVSHITASAREKTVEIKRLSCDLDGLKIDIKGIISPDQTMNLDATMRVEGFERIAPLFLLEGGPQGGDAEIKVAFKDLRWPLTKLPHMTGFARISNGFVRLPWIPKTIRQVDLNAEFSGEKLDAQIHQFVLGRTRLNSGRFSIEDRENPRFNLSLNFDTLDVSDFRSGKEFAVHPIRPDSMPAHISGTGAIQARNATLSDNISGTNLRIRGEMKNRRLAISRLTMNTMGGQARISGVADLAGPVPTLQAEGKITGIRADAFLKSMGAKTSVIEGQGIISGNLSAKGEHTQQFIDTVQGKATAYSENGVIRRWSLLSKLFGLLNVYDFFRGKVPVTESGLTYKKMGGTFRVKNGVFTTNDFLIDSPSMLITGKGDINVKTRQVKGTLAVSPLVALDRTIDKIPILRSIVKEKNRGFLYASYDVSGPIDNADLSLSVINTIGGRTIDILKNILVLPKELFQTQGPDVEGKD